MSDSTTLTSIIDARAFDYAWPTLIGHTSSWLTLFGACRRAVNGWVATPLARAVFDNWTLSGVTTVASGNPAELTLTLPGLDAGTRLLAPRPAATCPGNSLVCT